VNRNAGKDKYDLVVEREEVFQGDSGGGAIVVIFTTHKNKSRPASYRSRRGMNP